MNRHFSAQEVLDEIFSGALEEQEDEDVSEEEDGEEYNPEDDASSDEEEEEIPHADRETFLSKNGKIAWSSSNSDSNQGRTAASNIIRMTPGPTSYRAQSHPPFGKSDHAAIFLTPKYKQTLKREAPAQRAVARWTDQSVETLQDALDDVDWDMFQYSSDGDLHLFADSVVSFVGKLVDDSIPKARTAAYNEGLTSGNMERYKSASYGVRRALALKMSATAVPICTTRNGYTIVTQVIPPSTSTGPEQISYTVGPLQKFLKGEPKALGSVQIMIGLFTFLLGVVINLKMPAITVFSGIVFLGSLVYISSGSLAVSASNKLHSCVVKGALWMNVLSTITAGINIILLSLDLTIGPEFVHCYYRSTYGCSSNDLINGIFVMMLIFSITQFIISLCLSGFACKATYSAEPSVNITLAPNQVRSPDKSSEQYPPNSVNDVTICSPPMESPPPYSEIKVQEDN
ncbi:hypothetical protein MHYP_G00355320 [Metynnis hypsauchen]